MISKELPDVCGISVDIVTRGVFTDREFFDKQGNFVRFTSTASAKSTLTAENGRSVIIQNAGSFTDAEPLVDEEAGMITFSTTFKGLPEKIQTAHGPMLLRDAGLATFVDTFDLETGELISSDIIIKGLHPELIRRALQWARQTSKVARRAACFTSFKFRTRSL